MKRAKGRGPDCRMANRHFSIISFMIALWRGFSYGAQQTVCTLMAKIDAFFNLMFEQKASDVHLSSGNNPMLRINGELHRVDHPPLDADELKKMLYEIAPDYKIKVFEETGDVDFGYEIPNISRFRANFFQQKNGISACRQIPQVLSSGFEKFGAACAGPEKVLHAEQGIGCGDRSHGIGQVHHPRGDDGLREQEPERPRHHAGGSD